MAGSVAVVPGLFVRGEGGPEGADASRQVTDRVRDGVRDLLKGVEKNRAMIVTPLGSRMTWWTYRISPALMDFFCRLQVREFRKIRRPPGTGS